MKEIGMIVAMQQEAHPIIEHFKLIKKEGQRGGFNLYENDKICLVVSGVGTVNATMATMFLADDKKCEVLLNFGTSGGTGKRFKTGDIVSVNRVFKRDVNLTIAGYKEYEIPGNGIEISLGHDKNFPSCDCYTSDEFVGINSSVPTDIVVDMEAYCVAFVAKRYNMECKIYKVVSDLTETNEDDSEHSKNLEEASATMAEYIIKLVHEFSQEKQ